MTKSSFQIKTQQNQYRTIMTVSLHTLPLDIAYRIFDHLDDKHLFISASNISQRLNAIQTSYHRFRVSAQHY